MSHDFPMKSHWVTMFLYGHVCLHTLPIALGSSHGGVLGAAPQKVRPRAPPWLSIIKNGYVTMKNVGMV